MNSFQTKARENRIRALRIRALRSASVTNLFGPVDTAEAEDHAPRTARMMPRFIRHETGMLASGAATQAA